MGDLAWERNLFFSQTSGKRTFSWHTTVYDFFTALYVIKRIQCKILFPSKTVCRIFFSEITYTPPPAPQSQMVGPVGTGDRSQ